LAEWATEHPGLPHDTFLVHGEAGPQAELTGVLRAKGQRVTVPQLGERYEVQATGAWAIAE
jgi:hypothetical protein